MRHIEGQDPEVYSAIKQELNRQRMTLELIPSENSTSRAVMEAQATVLTNKYAEGYPGKRYYGGCQYVDIVEALADKRAKELFGAEHVNVQPHSGSQANMGVYLSYLKPGETLLGMSLKDGGHLTHGSPVNFSGFLYNVVSYGVKETDHLIDYDQVRALAKQHRPKLIVAGASAYPRVIRFDLFEEIAKEVGALLMVDMAHISGLVAAGVHPSPVAHADFVTSTTHKTLRGPRGGFILCKQQHAPLINKRVMPGMQGGPLMHVIAAKAICFKEAKTEDFKVYQKKVVSNACFLAESLAQQGFKLVSGGTDNHLVLIDLRNKGLTGKEAEERLDRVGLTVNKNSVPFDTAKPLVTSGIRLGTPAVTTRGMGENEMNWLGKAVSRVLASEDESVWNQVRQEVEELCKQFPIYGDL